MQRAAVLIGVKQTGNLPKLEAVSSSVKAMAGWANSQGIEDKYVRTLVDDNEPVTVQQIKKAVSDLVGLTTIDQLILYFSGHGFNIESEYWLLSDAPSDTDAAVNVDGSVRLARYCGIPHVVFVSDCCRSAAEGLQAMQVRGSNVFPNDPASGAGNSVDILYSCARGKPSLEITDPAASAADAARNYSALYSEVLLEYLRGEHEEALTHIVNSGHSVGLLQLGALADALKIEVPKRLKEKRGVDPKITQIPDDLISRKTAEALISQVPWVASRAQTIVKPVSRSRPVTPFTVSSRFITELLAGDLGKWKSLLTRKLGSNIEPFQASVALQADTFGPQHFETQCGIKIRGARIERTVQLGIGAELLGSDGQLVRLSGVPQGGSLLLLVLEDGSGAVIPAIPEFIASLTFKEGQLLDVSYEPSDNSWRATEFQARASELRSLRATISASAAYGAFQLNDKDALSLARKMQYAKGIDPSLALYAAYAYDNQQRRDLINEMLGYMQSDLGLSFFDIALLSGRPHSARSLPPFPMLSQGWALLSAYGAQLPSSLNGIDLLRVPSLWTLFSSEGVHRIEQAILSEEIR